MGIVDSSTPPLFRQQSQLTHDRRTVVIGTHPPQLAVADFEVLAEPQIELAARRWDLARGRAERAGVRGRAVVLSCHPVFLAEDALERGVRVRRRVEPGPQP